MLLAQVSTPVGAGECFSWRRYVSGLAQVWRKHDDLHRKTRFCGLGWRRSIPKCHTCAKRPADLLQKRHRPAPKGTGQRVDLRQRDLVVWGKGWPKGSKCFWRLATVPRRWRYCFQMPPPKDLSSSSVAILLPNASAKRLEFLAGGNIAPKCYHRETCEKRARPGRSCALTTTEGSNNKSDTPAEWLCVAGV